MIAKSLFILSLIALVSAVRVKDVPAKYKTVLMDFSSESTTSASSNFLQADKLYCALPTPSTQTGTYYQYYDNSHSFRIQADKNRQEAYTINFAQPFDEIPQVAVALLGFDINTASAGISVAAESVTTQSFKLVVTAPKGAKVYGAHVSWIATIPSKSQIWVQQYTIPRNIIAEFSETYGDRSAFVKFVYPRPLTNPGVLVAISGWEFGSGKNARLTLEPIQETQEGFLLKASTWMDTIWKSATVTVVVFEKKVDRATAIVATTRSGLLSTGQGTREEIKSVTFPSTLSGSVWSGLNLIDLSAKATYRLRSHTTTSGKVANTRFWTWDNSVVYLAQDVLFHIPSYQEYVTRTGVFEKVYWGTTHPFVSKRNSEQSETVWVSFPSPFSEVPSVGITLSGIDMDDPNPGVKISVEKVTTEGFYIKIVIFPNVSLYMIQIDWIATISSKSGIYILTLKDDSNSPAFKKLSTNFYTERPIEYTFDYPRAMTNPGVTVGISGFRMNSKNARIKVSPSSVEANKFKVTVTTWYDTALYYVGATILVYEKDCMHGVFETKSAITGVLHNGSGERMEKFEQSINIKNAITWTGISYLDMVTGYNFRLTEKATVNGEKINAVMKTWSDSKVYHAKANIFYTHPTR